MGFGFATWGGSPNYKGYLAEFVHLDGQYLDETYFGEFINGTWVPKNIYDQNFTFGTNGFICHFQIAVILDMIIKHQIEVAQQMIILLVD